VSRPSATPEHPQEPSPARLRLWDAQVVESVLAELRDIERRTGMDRTLAIGALILNRFYGGDPEAWRDRRRNKNHSIRRLAERGDCPLSKSALNEAVGIYVAVAALPRVRTFGHITSSHVASVLTLPATERLQALERADQERWSVRTLRRWVVSSRRAQGERRGRPAASDEHHALSMLASSVHRLERTMSQIGDLERWSESGRTEVTRLGCNLSRLAAQLGSRESRAGGHDSPPSSRRGFRSGASR
jgi:hypothetical protein